MKGNKFALLSGIALLGAAVIFGIPNSVWWDNGGALPRVLFGAAIGAEVFVVYSLTKRQK